MIGNLPMNNFLSISFKKSSYFPDELIEGYVQLNPLNQIVINDIIISLYLFENWLELFSIPFGESKRQLLLEMSLNIKNQLKIYTELVSLPAGSYIFPFQFKLPIFINPCFEFPSKEKKAYIRYSLDTKIISPYIQGATSTYILFKSRPKLNYKDNKQSFSSSIDVYKWRMFSEGNTVLNAFLDNIENNVKYGEEIYLNVDIDNNKGKLVTKEIKVVLIRKIDFKTKTKEIKDSISNDCIVKILNTLVNPGEKKIFKFLIDLQNMDNYTFDLKSEKLPYSNIKDMSYFLPSLNSSIIDCTYTLRITLYFESFVAYKHRPRVFIPINICHQKVEEYQPNFYINNNQNNNYNQINNTNNFQNNNIINNNNNQINEKEEEMDLPNKEDIEKVNEDNNMDGAPLCDAPAPVLGFNNNISVNNEKDNLNIININEKAS